jgi:hypothetical protein
MKKIAGSDFQCRDSDGLRSGGDKSYAENCRMPGRRFLLRPWW